MDLIEFICYYIMTLLVVFIIVGVYIVYIKDYSKIADKRIKEFAEKVEIEPLQYFFDNIFDEIYKKDKKEFIELSIIYGWFYKEDPKSILYIFYRSTVGEVYRLRELGIWIKKDDNASVLQVIKRGLRVEKRQMDIISNVLFLWEKINEKDNI